MGTVLQKLRRLRLHLAGLALAIVAIACGPTEALQDPLPWGEEAASYFDELAVAYVANDYYGVLDFYTSDAYQERWRGAVRGGALVRDLLVWNSGDLGHEVIGTHLSPEGALNLIEWESAGGLSVVVSTIENGVITGETVYDHGAWLDAGLRSSPDVVSGYEALYRRYAEAWTDSRADDLRSIYSDEAVLRETLGGDAGRGVDSLIESGSSLERVDGIELSETVNTVGLSGPGIFLGPADYGIDPGRAVAIYNVTDGSDCSRQMAVVWQVSDGQIIDETRYEEVESFARCNLETLPDGWWTGLGLPPPSDEVVTGVVLTEQGHELEVRNGTPLLEELLLAGLDRFGRAGLDEPRFDSVIFEPSRRCEQRSGRLIQDEFSRELFLCLFDTDLCPGRSNCTAPTLGVRSAVLHELAHAWIIDYVGATIRDQLLASTGREVWQDDGVPWPERGVEYAAEVITWGLLEETSPMVRIGRPSCEELTASFELLTGADSLRMAGECGSR